MSMDSQTKILMFITISITLLLQTQTQSPSLIKQLCGKTKNATLIFCIQTLESDNRTFKAKTALKITEIFLSLGIEDANRTRDYITELSNTGGQNPRFRSALEVCADSCNSTSLNFRSALEEVEEGESEIANYDIMVCYDQLTLCENALSGAQVHVPTISQRLNVTSNFISVASTFTNIL